MATVVPWASCDRGKEVVAVTTAASLKLNAKTVSESLRRVDESELAPADRALITRAVLLAYDYFDGKYDLAVEVKRFDELPVLSAVADRTQLTTVLTDAGEMLTQASFMVKNNDKQFQRFTLPKGAEFWSAYVNGQAVKTEKQDGDLLVPLPRGANRDQAFAVEIVYAQNIGSIKDIVLDPDGRVATWNTGAQRIKGYTADEIVGQHFSRFYPQEDVDRGKPAEFEVGGVIKGWTEALQLMKVGGKAHLVIPPAIGYGVEGAGPCSRGSRPTTS